MSATSASDRRPLVAVVGAGISGLTAAWRLATAPDSPRVVVLEQSPRIGGKLLLGTLGDHTIDLGAESVLARRPEAVDLISEVGLGSDVVHPVTTSASVVRDGRLHPMPPGTVMGVPGRPDRLAGLLTPDEVSRVEAEPGIPPTPVGEDVDVASFVASRVGPAVVDRLVEPLLGGVYAGHADRLSLRVTVPPLWTAATSGGSLLTAVRTITEPPPDPASLERPAEETARGTPPARPVFAGLRGGVGRLPQRLAEHLADLGIEVRTGVTVRRLRRTPSGWLLVTGPVPAPVTLAADAVVLAVPPAPAARLLRDEVPAAARELAPVETASVALVAALVPRAAAAGWRGSGLLVPPVEHRAIKAATFASSKWAWVDDLDRNHVVVRASLGRAGEEALLQRDDDELAALALADLGDLVGRQLQPVATRVVRWGGALPQPAVGHAAAMERLRAAIAAAPHLAVCGAALDGVGIPACVAAATRAASEVVKGLGRLPEVRGASAAAEAEGRMGA
jgi:oxygen-dependent protoporphyrinogen oxidase